MAPLVCGFEAGRGKAWRGKVWRGRARTGAARQGKDIEARLSRAEYEWAREALDELPDTHDRAVAVSALFGPRMKGILEESRREWRGCGCALHVAERAWSEARGRAGHGRQGGARERPAVRTQRGG